MTSTIEIILPDLLANWPYKAQPNPRQDIVADSAAWAESYGAFNPRAQDAFNRCKFGIFSSLAYPKAGPEHFRAGCDLMNLFFVFDEKSDEASGDEVGRQAVEIMNALRNPTEIVPGESVLGPMTRSFWNRTLLVASPSSARRIIKYFDEYTEAVRQQAVDRETRRIRSIEEYISLRRATIGVLPSFEFFLLAEDLPDSVVSDPHIEKLASAAVDMTIFANDLYSYNVEQSRGDDAHNIVTVAMKEQGLELQSAVDHVGEQYQRLAQSFCQDMRELPTFPDDVDLLAKEYADGMGLWVYTNIKWSFASERYFGTEGLAIEKHRRSLSSLFHLSSSTFFSIFSSGTGYPTDLHDMSYPQQPPHSYQPNPSGASMQDPFASRRNSVASAYSHASNSSVGSGMSASVGGVPQASYAYGPRPAPSILSDHGDGQYPDHRSGSRAGSVTSHQSPYNIGVDPAGWTTKPEADDFLHDPRSEKKGRGAKGLSRRGLMNIGCLVLIVLIIVGGAVAYPLARHFMNQNKSSTAASANSALNANLPNISSWSLIDVATPQDAYTIPSYHDPTKSMKLVFSDEFETAGRSFYPGDDPYWEAVDLYYWQTGDLEWYDPSAVTTNNGALEITLSKVDDVSLNHNLTYRSARYDLLVEQILLHGRDPREQRHPPGANNVLGLWPAVWAMGNLGRAGYGASLDGMWPYSYDSCDVGTLPNQTLPDNSGPQAALDTGGPTRTGAELPPRAAPQCGESHPGPKTANGSFVGRSAPEIDVFEATISGPTGALFGQVSQSAQWAVRCPSLLLSSSPCPFDASYRSFNSTDNLIIPDPSSTAQNAFVGNTFQQTTNQSCYQLSGQCFSTYGFEYVPGYADAVRFFRFFNPRILILESFPSHPFLAYMYISWIADDKLVWTMNGNMVGADTVTEIGARQVPVEPMYVIMNLGLSENFGFIDFEHLTFPAVMRVDYVRVYQDPDNVQVGCNPADYPTAEYINQYMQAYTDANLTTWVDDFHQVIPKNRLADTC
ncbi:beta-glucan synthesis-associated protein-domain-containing protein [Mycena galopus ATCC 62051]|nr:beta-glucan synthesis-associated protein-domain-containing protein [Mycena galopus ATCC 62051]